MLCCADGTANAFESLTDDKVVARCRRILAAEGLMSFGDGGEPASDGRVGEETGAVRNVECDGGWRSWKRSKVVLWNSGARRVWVGKTGHATPSP